MSGYHYDFSTCMFFFNITDKIYSIAIRQVIIEKKKIGIVFL